MKNSCTICFEILHEAKRFAFREFHIIAFHEVVDIYSRNT